MILTDTFIIENAELLIEQRQGKTIRRLRGIFGRCDEKNNNGRVYSKPLLEREVKRISEAMSERRLLGELDHPTHDAVKLSNVSHLITGLDFNGRELMGECELLDTPAGKVAQALVEGGVKIGISSRGMGTLSEHSDGTKHVNEDFKLVTFDLVADPSTRGAFPGITESSLVEEIVKDTLDKAAKEKVFTTMLKKKLREKLNINQKPAPYKSARQHQKDADEQHPKKPTAEDPFRNWEYFYGAYTGKPRVVKKRNYPDAETVTAPAEVVENKYSLLKDILTESTERPVNEFRVLSEIITRSVDEGDKNLDTRGMGHKDYYELGMDASRPTQSKPKKDDSLALLRQKKTARRAHGRAAGVEYTHKHKGSQGGVKGSQTSAEVKSHKGEDERAERRGKKPVDEGVNIFFPTY